MHNIIVNTNSNDVVSIEVNGYVEQFNQFSRKTAESVIGMGLVVYNAKTKLESINFDHFCQAIRFKSDSSAVRKLYQIGVMADQLGKHTDKLPSTWTTLYQLTQLGGEVLENCVENGKVFASMSGIQAKQLVDNIKGTSTNCSKRNTTIARQSTTPETDDGCVLMIRFGKTPTQQDAQALESALLLLVKAYGQCSVSRSPTLDAFMSSANESTKLAA